MNTHAKYTFFKIYYKGCSCFAKLECKVNLMSPYHFQRQISKTRTDGHHISLMQCQFLNTTTSIYTVPILTRIS